MALSIRTIFFFIVMIGYFIFPFSMIYQNEDILEIGETYRFLPRAYDPFDAFRGRYVTLDYAGLSIDYPNAEATFNRHETVYVKILRDQNNYAYFAEISPTPYDSPNYIETTARYVRKDHVAINKPANMSRYYMNEEIAPVAEKVYRDLAGRRGQARDSTQLYMDVKVHHGKAVIEELYMNGIKANDYIKQQIEEGLYE